MADLLPVPVESRPLATPAPPATSDQARLLAGAFLAGYGGRTRDAYRGDLEHFGAWCAGVGVEVLEATRAHVQLYARTLEEAGRAPGTIGRRLSTLSGFYAYAVAEGVLARNPVAHVRRPRVSDDSPRLGCSRAELRSLLSAAEVDSPQSYVLVCLLALNGLRVSEACGARAGDLTEVRGHQVLAVRRKGGKRAQVPLAPRTAAAVQQLLKTRGDDARNPGPLLNLDRFAAHRMVVRLAAAAGIEKRISPHSLRHTFCTLALEAGVPLHDVQDAMAHADPRTTQRYNRARHQLDSHATYAVADFLA